MSRLLNGSGYFCSCWWLIKNAFVNDTLKSLKECSPLCKHFLKFFVHIWRKISSAKNTPTAQEILRGDPKLPTYLKRYLWQLWHFGTNPSAPCTSTLEPTSAPLLSAHRGVEIANVNGPPDLINLRWIHISRQWRWGRDNCSHCWQHAHIRCRIGLSRDGQGNAGSQGEHHSRTNSL